ncbi:MAG: Cupredoxin-like domain [Frankiaceae bacterium]|jgi:plastocyanin|nr:Cupredoxin-like domain [Frankiaceae bacterium]
MIDSGASYAFAPTSVTVSCGGTVKVTNNSTNEHTMTPNKGGFTGTSSLAPTMSATVRFSYRGTYGFYCSIHPYMTGTVKVT